MRSIFYTACAAALLLLAPLASSANNLRVTGYLFYPTVGIPGSADVRCTVAWDNSWRDAENWDAVWVFGKYRDSRVPNAPWQPLTVGPSPLTAGAIQLAADGRGLFVHRTAPGAGPFSTSVTLRWNYTADGLTANDFAYYQVQLFGIEMVYVPEGSFNLNAAELPGQANEFVSQAGSLTAITSEAALPVGAIRWVNDTGGGGSGNAVMSGINTYPGSAALPATYPKGFAATYCMKYEVSQGQYTDFLNTLTRPQQNQRVPVDVSGDAPASGLMYVMAEVATAADAFRNTITCPLNGMGTTAPIAFSCTRPDRAANFLIWADAAAYLDWAGLRPQSELEYEKACRGPLAAVPGELASGAVVPTSAGAVVINGPEDGTETTDPATPYAVGFQIYTGGGDGGSGPVRCGIFATATSTRAQAGASYYGIMEMSGNCWERTVTVAEFDNGQPTNAGAFDYNQNGDGRLTAAGDHDVPTWPNATDVLGSNFRGGNWSRPAEWAAVSDRQYGASAIAGRTSHRGIRGTRSLSTLVGQPTGTNGTATLPAKYFGGSFDGYGNAGPLTHIITGLPAELAGLAPAVLASPNPATGAITLHLRAAPLTAAALTLTDALGRPVRHLTALTGPTITLERANLAAGLYFYHLTDGGTPVATGRLVWE